MNVVRSEFRSDLGTFIRNRFTSVEDVDVVVLLLKHPSRMWTDADVAAELGFSREIASRCLSLLAAAGLISGDGAATPRYRYVTSDDVQDAMLRDLAHACFVNRGAIAAAIEPRRQPLVRRIAHAFRQWNR